MIQLNLKNSRRVTDLENKRMVAGGGGIHWEFRTDMDSLLYLKWITNTDILNST